MYNLINKADDFQSCVDSLSQKSQFSIDLEFDKNRFRYGFNLCLMQIFDGKDCYADADEQGLLSMLAFP